MILDTDLYYIYSDYFRGYIDWAMIKRDKTRYKCLIDNYDVSSFYKILLQYYIA